MPKIRFVVKTLRKNNYYNFSALIVYEPDTQVAQAFTMDFDGWIFFSCVDDTNAGGFIHVL